MAQQLLLNLGQGHWQTGFANVSMQRWETGQPPVQFVGSLPPAPALAADYQRWQQLYGALYGPRAYWQQPASPSAGGKASEKASKKASEKASETAGEFEFETGGLTNVSHHDFETLGTTLKTSLNQWLNSKGFAFIERQIRTQLGPSESIRFMLIAQDKAVLRFPWRLWSLFEDYPQAELSVSLPSYGRAIKQQTGKQRTDKKPGKAPGQVKILAVLGNDKGIDVETDRRLLSQLPAGQVTLLSQPSLAEFQQQLWDTPWDLLFFAGHSSSQGQGCLQVNRTESLTVGQLKYALRRAIANGLQLAVLNSCDGLQLAWDLADLHLPQAIVMREPVSDAIAQQFLKAFLTAFSHDQSLYLSVREARERLYGQPGNYAAWLPVIVQNPAEVPPTWQSLRGITAGEQFSSETVTDRERLGARERLVGRRGQGAVGRTAVARPVIRVAAIALTILGLRWAGLLQGVELQAYDTLMKLRPIESPDPRIVVVTVDESDIQRQTSSERRGSLSDETLQQTLSILDSYEPRVIALDLYRDFPALTPELAEFLARPEMVGVCKSRDPVADKVGIRATPEIPPEQIGFSDFIEETDGTLRRQLLTLTPDPVSPCVTPYGFAALVALQYLAGDNFQPEFSAQGDLKVGETVFPRLARRTGGLQRMDNRGNQVLLNYRVLPRPEQIAAHIPLQQLLVGQVNGARVRDRIVFIGVTAPSGDYWATPYGVQGQNKTAGVFMQAQMTSQLVSAVLDGRTLIWVWPQWLESLSIVMAAMSGLLVWKGNPTRLFFLYLLSASGLVIIAWAVLLKGGWLPVVPVLLALGSGLLSGTVVSHPRQNARQNE
ncbi:MAG: CHASE2 domain-containing protein [Cyanobacteria bacterium P01_A01_bin.116]